MCLPSRRTVLACGPFSPSSSAKATAVPGLSRREAAVEHAVPMEIDLAAVGGGDEAELAGRVDPRHAAGGRRLVVLDLPLEPRARDPGAGAGPA